MTAIREAKYHHKEFNKVIIIWIVVKFNNLFNILKKTQENHNVDNLTFQIVVIKDKIHNNNIMISNIRII